MTIILCYPTFSDNELTSLLSLRSDASLAHLLLNSASQTSLIDIREWMISRNRFPSQRGLFMIYDKLSFSAYSFAGYIVYDRIDLTNSFSIGLCLSPESRSRGFGFSSVHLLISYLTLTYSPHKFVFHSLSSNFPSIALFKKLGFKIKSVTKIPFILKAHIMMLCVERS